jgi:hypothetical protein
MKKFLMTTIMGMAVLGVSTFAFADLQADTQSEAVREIEMDAASELALDPMFVAGRRGVGGGSVVHRGSVGGGRSGGVTIIRHHNGPRPGGSYNGGGTVIHHPYPGSGGYHGGGGYGDGRTVIRHHRGPVYHHGDSRYVGDRYWGNWGSHRGSWNTYTCYVQDEHGATFSGVAYNPATAEQLAFDQCFQYSYDGCSFVDCNGN